MARTQIDTHVLDHLTGGCAVGMRVELERSGSSGWMPVGAGITDADGRNRELTPDGVDAGTYRLVFATGEYFAGRGHESFFPRVTVEFVVQDADVRCHVPLLVTPRWYSSYLGV